MSWAVWFLHLIKSVCCNTPKSPHFIYVKTCRETITIHKMIQEYSHFFVFVLCRRINNFIVLREHTEEMRQRRHLHCIWASKWRKNECGEGCLVCLWQLRQRLCNIPLREFRKEEAWVIVAICVRWPKQHRGEIQEDVNNSIWWCSTGESTRPSNTPVCSIGDSKPVHNRQSHRRWPQVGSSLYKTYIYSTLYLHIYK